MSTAILLGYLFEFDDFSLLRSFNAEAVELVRLRIIRMRSPGGKAITDSAASSFHSQTSICDFDTYSGAIKNQFGWCDDAQRVKVIVLVIGR